MQREVYLKPEMKSEELEQGGLLATLGSGVTDPSPPNPPNPPNPPHPMCSWFFFGGCG
jgi:hypothetical protein